jgi:hypothetical protein
VDVAAVVLGVSTALGGAGSAFLWLETRGDRGHKKRLEEVETCLGPVRAEIAALHTKVDHTGDTVRLAVSDAMEPVNIQITALNTKIEPLWKALVDSAMHNAEVLHHPHLERREIDTLLDHFRDNVLTVDEEGQLRRFLVQIKNWEPGISLGFPVYDGEPSAAANLLSMLELVKIYRGRSTGHNAG